MTSLPPPAPGPSGTPYRIGLVCLGNICRSPMAHVVLAELVNRAGLAEQVEVSSAGTGGWHVGEPMDPRAAATLLAADYDPSGQRAEQVDAAWLHKDLLLAMDEQNLADVRALDPAAPVRLFRDYDPLGWSDDSRGDVPDPWYGGPEGFNDVLAIVERTCIAIVGELERVFKQR